MVYSASHRNAASMSTTSLVPPQPTHARQRRMTTSSLPPPSPLNLPEPVQGYRRPPSPLRNGTTIDPTTGELSDAGSIQRSEDGDEGRWTRSHSPSPSVAKFAANIAQRVGSLMSTVSPRSHALPTDDELEAEAERERDRSRREAERILMMEAENKRAAEECVMHSSGDGPSSSLLPPPPLSQTTSATPSSPKSSQKEGSWWAMAKNRLTPTKEPLTPAQQIIEETKAREKEHEKEKKKAGKGKQRKDSWPSAPDAKFDDPAFIQLGLASSITPPPPKFVSAAPSSPTPFNFHGLPGTPPSLSTSPLRSMEVRNSSPTRTPAPMYAQFNAQGTLDVPGTLLTIVQRFEKLEKWTVGHVRALEERMDDVERWLVEKEKEKQKEQEQPAARQLPNGDMEAREGDMGEIREELAELSGRVTELGREMARMLTASANLLPGPSRSTASIARSPTTTSSVAIFSISQNVSSSPQTTPPNSTGAISPPPSRPAMPTRTSRTRLPYPTGDYATPPDSTLLSQGVFSPGSSPPSSITSASKVPHMSPSDLPPSVEPSNPLPSGLPRTASPSNSTGSATESPPATPSAITATASTTSVVRSASPVELPPPIIPAARTNSASPTPRKRYTVALGGPIMSASRSEQERPMTPASHPQTRELSTAFFSTSSNATTEDEDSDAGGANDETIGKSVARRGGLATQSDTSDNGHGRTPSASSATSQGSQLRRSRPRTIFRKQHPSNGSIAAPSPITPLNIRLRSRSSDRFGLGISDPSGAPITPVSSKFVDPLVVRRQTKEALAGTVPNPPKVMPGKPKVPVGELVAYFDQEKA